MQWLNGEPQIGTIAPFDLRDRGLLLGDGVFDTVMVAQGRAVFAEAHLARLAASCAAFDIPFDARVAQATLGNAARKIVTGSVRTTITRGPAPRGLDLPDACAPVILTQAHAGPLSAAWRPLRAIETPIRRNETSPLAGHKCLSYMDAIWAMRQAKAAGADEAIFANTQGHVASCATGNIFVILKDTLRTPPLSDGILPGVVRAQLLDLGRALFRDVEEASLTPDILHSAQAVFMTNSLRLIAPITSLNGRALALNTPLLAELAQALYDRVDSRTDLSKDFAAWPTTD